MTLLKRHTYARLLNNYAITQNTNEMRHFMMTFWLPARRRFNSDGDGLEDSRSHNVDAEMQMYSSSVVIILEKLIRRYSFFFFLESPEDIASDNRLYISRVASEQAHGIHITGQTSQWTGPANIQRTARSQD